MFWEEPSIMRANIYGGQDGCLVQFIETQDILVVVNSVCSGVARAWLNNVFIVKMSDYITGFWCSIVSNQTVGLVTVLSLSLCSVLLQLAQLVAFRFPAVLF